MSIEKTRAVGNFDVLYAPLNPLGIFNAEAFKESVYELIAKNSTRIGLDLTGISEIYSDAYNAFLEINALLRSKGGEFVLILDSDDLENSLARNCVQRCLLIFKSEADLLNYSIRESVGIKIKREEKSLLQKSEQLENLKAEKKEISEKEDQTPIAEESLEVDKGTSFWLFLIIGFIGIFVLAAFLFL